MHYHRLKRDEINFQHMSLHHPAEGMGLTTLAGHPSFIIKYGDDNAVQTSMVPPSAVCIN